jgi:DNA invertase Pin-like site-specific DNA recombinase
LGLSDGYGFQNDQGLRLHPYLVSNQCRVGPDKDSDRRQRAAITAFAKATGFEIEEWFCDPAVSGADPIDTRPGFSAMMRLIQSNGVRTVICETASRFARDLMKLIRQVLGAVSEFEKAMTVAKLRGSRERIRLAKGKCEGRKSHSEARPDAVAMAKQLRRVSPKTKKRRTLEQISIELANAGYLNSKRNPFSASAIKSMLERPL